MEAKLDPPTAAPVGASNVPKWVWAAGGAVALTAAALGGALTQAHRTPEVAAPQAANAVPAAPLDMPEPKVAKAEPAPVATPAPRPVATPAPVARAEAPAPVCSNCGVVESVQPVKVKGQGSGAGAVAGGVLGGVVGNQFGKGNGRAAMTVLGAVGGGFAGHEVEKQVKAKTVYSVKLRMDDGSLRTVQQVQAPPVGERFRVDGANLHAI